MFFIDPILNMLNAIAPQMKITGIEQVQLIDKMSLADNININIHFDVGDKITPTAFITPRKHQLENNTEENSIMFSSSPESEQNLAAQNIPFNSGTHLIINQESFWNNSQVFKFGQIKIIPLQYDEQKTVETMKIIRPESFSVQYKSTEELLTTIWTSCGDTKKINLSGTSNQQSLFIKNSNWTFKKYLPDQVMKFEWIPEIVLSFDENIVKESIQIKREHSIRKNEYYVFVVSV